MVDSTERRQALLSVEAGLPSKRILGDQAGIGEYSITAETYKGFHTSIYEDFPLVTDGEVTTGMSYRMTLDGAEMISASEPNKNDNPYIDVITFNSWLADMVHALVNAGIFFVSAYSHATFIAASYVLTQHADHSKTMYINLRWTLIGLVLLDYSIQLALSWRQTREFHSLLESMGDLVFNDDIHTGRGSTLSARNRWKVFMCLTIAHMLNLRNKLMIGPLYFQTRKMTRLGSNFKAGNARLSFVGYRNAWEFHVEDRIGQYGRTQASIVTDTLAIVLKALLSASSNVNWFFIFVNVGVPILLLMLKLKDVWDLRTLRAGFRQRLEDDVQSNDPILRAISRAQLQKHYGVNVTSDGSEKESLKAPASYTHMEMLARRVDKSLVQLTFNLEVLEKGGKLYHGEGLRLLQPIRQRIKQASFPCFFEIAPPSKMHVSSFGFPHDLGPFALQAVDIDLTMHSSLTTPTTSGRARTTPWKVPLGSFAGSIVAIECATDDVVQGYLSALSEVTIESDQKIEVGVPQDARWFAWSYPVATRDRISEDTLRKCMAHHTGPDAFLLSGGYVYFNSELKLVKVLAARRERAGELTGLLGFQIPIPILDPGPLAKVLKEARAARTGFPLSVHCGGEECKHLRCMWLSPREIESEKPSLGGFLFYNEAALSN